jgi:hypothetical protein
MSLMSPEQPNPSFGDPDFCYSKAGLIKAVNEYPSRFCEETHQLVRELIAREIEIHRQEANTTYHQHHTQPTQS